MFQSYCKDRKSGGILVYVMNQLEATGGRTWRDDIEAIWLEMRVEKSVILLCNMYRPPDASMSLMEGVSNMIEQALREGKEMVIMGDLNCNTLSPNSTTNHLTSIMEDYQLTQLISEPMRITDHSQ